MNKKKNEIKKTEPDKATAESIGQMAGKILDSALCLVDKRISFAAQNCQILDDLCEYIESIDKEDMSKTEKNNIIRKINDLKLSKISDIASVISMCRDKLGISDEDDSDNEIVFMIDYGDEQSEICIKEEINED